MERKRYIRMRAPVAYGQSNIYSNMGCDGQRRASVARKRLSAARWRCSAVACRLPADEAGIRWKACSLGRPDSAARALQDDGAAGARTCGNCACAPGPQVRTRTLQDGGALWRERRLERSNGASGGLLSFGFLLSLPPPFALGVSVSPRIPTSRSRHWRSR